MRQSKLQYRSSIHTRNIWLYATAGLLIVLAGFLVSGYNEEIGFSLSRALQFHRDNPVLFLFEGLPLYILVILSAARRNLRKFTGEYDKEMDRMSNLIERNAQFARELSEGADPDEFPGMLNAEPGISLRLIHLNIRSNRRKERELTWITEGKEMISRVLRLYNDIDELSYKVLTQLSIYINAVQGAMYLYDEEKKELRNVAVMAYNRRKYIDQVFGIGEGLVGQCAYEMDYIYRTEIPEEYVTITSGILGDQKPGSILLVPLITNEQLQGVVEFAFLDTRIPKLSIQFMLELGEIIARTLFNLRVNMRTHQLLEESRNMTAELQENEQVLKENAEEMKTTQEELQQANIQLEQKIREEKLAQDRLHWLLENTSEVISIYDRSFRLTYISPSVEHILGYSREEMLNGKDFERIDQKSSTAIRKAFEQLLQEPEETVRLEYEFLRKDGKRVSLMSSIRNLLDDPSIKGYVFNTHDITETKLIEKEQRLTSRMQSLSENSLDLILRINTDGIIHYANPVVEDYTRIPLSDMLNRSIHDIILNKALDAIIENAIHKISRKPAKMNLEESIPVEMGGKKGERTVNFNIIPEFQNNELETILFVGHDVTEARRIEQEIKVTNRKVQDSINYAERIQSSILPSTEGIRKAFPESFIFYKPKDVISGDFPWFYESEDAWFIAAIDCTGHGVPGALLSFIGFFLLNNITSMNAGKSPGELLNALNGEVRRTLKQDQTNPDTRDGMDLAFCKIFKSGGRMEYSGAHRPLYRLREGEVSVYKGDRKAIGGLVNPRKPEQEFTTHRVDRLPGDKIFFFSDGLTDQMGGPEGLKYSPARVREKLLNNPGFTIKQFNETFRADFDQWKGEEVQIDDVLMIGIGF